MNIEKWIKDNTWRGHVDEAALRDLLKTHAIVPREPSNNMIDAGFIAHSECDTMIIDREGACYKSMIEAAENEQ